MNWHWIVLIVVCYVLLSAITCIILSRMAKSADSGIIVLFGIFWPVFVILLPVIMFIILLYEIVDKCRYKDF